MRILDWAHHENSKAWIQLEQTLLPHSLKSTPWLPPKNHPPSVRDYPLINYCLNVWDSLRTTANLTTTHSPLTPLKFNKGFPPGLQAEYFAKWQGKEVTQIYHICPTGVIPSWEPIQNTFSLPRTEHFKYHQLSSFIRTTLSHPAASPLYTEFEKLCTRSSPPLRNITSLYNR